MAMMSFSTIIYRYGLLTASILISTINIAFLSCGVFAWGTAADTKAAWVVATIGFVLFAVSFVGCCVSLRDSYTLSMVFCAVSLVFLLVQFVYVIIFAVMQDGIVERAIARVEATWAEEQKTHGAMNPMEISHKCCGLIGPEDYVKKSADLLPRSCCWAQDCSVPANIYEVGCKLAVPMDVEEQSFYFIWSNVALLATFVFGAICAYYHGKQFDSSSEKKCDEVVINQ